jgi:hypothetical protein
MGPRLPRIFSQVAEQVLDPGLYVLLLRGVAQVSGHQIELPPSLLRVSVAAREFRLRQGQIRQRIRPGDAFGPPLGLRNGRGAGLAIATEPVQLSLMSPYFDDVLHGSDLVEHHQRLFVVRASTGEVTPEGDLTRQLGQGQ